MLNRGKHEKNLSSGYVRSINGQSGSSVSSYNKNISQFKNSENQEQ